MKKFFKIRKLAEYNREVNRSIKDIDNFWQQQQEDSKAFETALRLYFFTQRNIRFRVGKNRGYLSYYNGLPVIQDDTLADDKIIVEEIE